MPQSLTYEGILAGAIEASKNGLSFDEYCELILKVIISGQSKDFIKGVFMGQGLHIFFQGDEGMIAHDAAQYYLEQPNTFSVADVRQKFGGEILISGGKPYILFPDKTTLSIQKIVEAKFKGKDDERSVVCGVARNTLA